MFLKLHFPVYPLSELSKGFILFVLLFTTLGSTGAQTITTMAGNGGQGFGGDGGPATSAILNRPAGIAVDRNNNIYIVDKDNYRIRKIFTNGNISTIAGTGRSGFSGDGNLATSADLGNPTGIAVDKYGNLYIADEFNDRIRKVSTAGIITTVAGTGIYGYSGDGGLATNANLGHPSGVAIDDPGNLYIADNQRIRKISPDGIITTVAGTGTYGFSGDGGLAINAALGFPCGVAVDGNRNLYIVDQYNQRIRKVSTNGIITTVVGNGTVGFTGDGIAATNSGLTYPRGVAVDSIGNLYVADQGSHRIRKVSPDGIITTVAGNGTNGFGGDGGMGTSASLAYPLGVGLDVVGHVYIADQYNSRIRKVTVPPTVHIQPVNPLSVCSGSSFTLAAKTLGFMATSYSWNSQPSGILGSGASPTFTAPSVTSNTAYTVAVTASNNNIYSTRTTTLVIQSTPATSLTITASPGLTVVSGQNATLTASGASMFTWSTGATTPTITVSTTGPYSVTGTTDGCSAQTSVVINGVITSVQNGNWSTATTWNCNCLPTQYDLVRIDTGHNITVNQAVQARNLKQNGTLFLRSGGKISF